MMSSHDVSPITGAPVNMASAWTNRDLKQRFRVEYDANAARYCVRVAGRFELLEQAPRLASGELDLSGASEPFREEVRFLEALERDEVVGEPLPDEDDRPPAAFF